MPPVPGAVNPALEQQGRWQDFHASFLVYWRELLAANLPAKYELRIEERFVILDESADEARAFRADVAVVRPSDASSGGSSESESAGGAAVAVETAVQPALIPLPLEEELGERFLQIVHRPDGRLVAILELLSPTNKSGAGYGEYLARRRAILAEPVHLVELDLLQDGRRLPMRKELPAGDCFAFVSRAERRPLSEVYAWPLAARAPRLPVPLAPPDPDVWFDLGDLLGQTYARAGYRVG